MQSTPVTTAPALPVLRTAKVLLIHQDEDEAQVIADRLVGDDLDVLLAESAEAAASRLRSGPADLLVVRGSMLAVERLRAGGLVTSGCPVIALCDGEAQERTRALQRGATDSLSMPVYGPELSERVRLALERGEVVSGDRLQAIEVPGGMRIVVAAHEVEIRGQRVEISHKEFALLLVLAREPERVFTKHELLREVWGYQSPGTTRTLDSHACRLRGKLAEFGGSYIVNKWGVGYRLLPLR